MAKALIKLAYKHAIDALSVTDFEKKVFNTSYQEFLMKSQAYNMDGKFKTFDEIKANDGRANSLHYKLSIAVTHIVEELGNKIPGLDDQLGNDVLFETPEFKLLASDLSIKTAHEVSITYVTGGLTLVNTIHDYLVLAIGDQRENTGSIDTFMIKMQPNLAIAQYEELQVLV
jgi:hypothetical protein